MTRLKMLLSTVTVNKKLVWRNEYVCSDGFTSFNGYEANKHEMLLKIQELFNDVAVRTAKRGHTRRYFFTHNFSIDCGVYRLAVKNADDLEALDHYFTGIAMKLGFPTEFPFEFNLDIFYESIPGVIRDQAQWKVYNIKDYQK